MKITAAEYDTAKAMGFKPYWHKLSGFSEACFNQNAFSDLRDCRTAPADAADLKAWEINETEWRAAQAAAIELAMAIHEEEN